VVSDLIDLFGWEMLLTASGLDPNGFGEVTNRYATWIQQYFDALGEADVPVVMIHDDIVWTSGAIFHPDWYRKFVFPNYKRLFAPILDSGKKLIYTSDGTYTEFIDDIANCGVHGFVLEPTTDMMYIAERHGKTHVFVGNADTRVLLSGSREDIRAEVKRCMDIGKDCPGFFLAVGNHIPPNTPVDNALYYNDVYEELSRR
jgi:uroporphyrinogen-III decarboxylase